MTEIRRKYHTITAFFVPGRTLRYYHPDGVLKKVSPADPIDAWYFRVRKMQAPYEINVDSDTADHARLDIFINYRVTDEVVELRAGEGLEALLQRIDEGLYRAKHGGRDQVRTEIDSGRT